MSLSVPYIGFTVVLKRVQGRKALVVTDVDLSGPGALCGLQDGDELLAFGETRTPTMSNFKKAYKFQAIPFRSVPLEIQRVDPASGANIKKSFQLTIGEQRQEIIDVLPTMVTAHDIITVLDTPSMTDKVKRALFQAIDTTESGIVSRKECLEGIPQCDPFGAFSSQELIRHYNACDPEKSGFLFEAEFDVLADRLLKGVLNYMQVPESQVMEPMLSGEPKGQIRRNSSQLGCGDSEGFLRPIAGRFAQYWLSFSVVKARGRSAVYICDVAEDGIAHRLGLEEGDELIWIGDSDGKASTRIDSLKAYLEAHQRHVVAGNSLKLKVLKPGGVGPRAFDLVVGPCPDASTRPSSDISTFEKLAEVVKSEEQLRDQCAKATRIMDKQQCGIVGFPDFVTKLREWISGEAGMLFGDEILNAAWGRHDHSNEKCLPVHTVELLLRSLLQLAANFSRLARKDKYELHRKKYNQPVDTHAVYDQWRQHGWLSGTFSEAKSKEWTKVSCANTHHLLVSLSHTIQVRCGDQTEHLSPGDEIFIPAGQSYEVMALADCRYMFGIQHRIVPSIPIPYMIEAWGPLPVASCLLLPWMGFSVERQKFRPTLYLKDVLPYGPAGRQGLKDMDELVSIAGIPVPSIAVYRRVMRIHVEVGSVVAVQVRRKVPEIPERVLFKMDVRVEAKEKEPPMRGLLPSCLNNLTEVDALIKDKPRLGRIARALFTQADCDDSQALSRSEFLAFIPNWIAPQLLTGVDNKELLKAFGKADKEKTNYIMLADFPLALHSVLLMLVPSTDAQEAAKPNVSQAKPPREPLRPKQRPATKPAATSKVTPKHITSASILETPPRPLTPPSPTEAAPKLRTPASKRAASVGARRLSSDSASHSKSKPTRERSRSPKAPKAAAKQRSRSLTIMEGNISAWDQPESTDTP